MPPLAVPSDGLKLALNVGAMLLAFVGLIALLNGTLGYLGGLIGFEDFSLQLFLGWLFSPVAWLLGIPWEHASVGGSFIGQKIVINDSTRSYHSKKSKILSAHALRPS